MLLSLVLASGIVWIGSHSRFIPYAVEIDKVGYASPQISGALGFSISAIEATKYEAPDIGAEG
jgi:type IV secretory pathway TrbF-like protein